MRILYQQVFGFFFAKNVVFCGTITIVKTGLHLSGHLTTFTTIQKDYWNTIRFVIKKSVTALHFNAVTDLESMSYRALLTYLPLIVFGKWCLLSGQQFPPGKYLPPISQARLL